MENRLQNRKRINNAMLVLRNHANNVDAEAIHRSIHSLSEALAWARAHNFIEDQNDALWGLHRCYQRMHRPSDSIAALFELHDNLERMRRLVRNVYRRSSPLTLFPKLYSELAHLLYESNRIPELLDVIEAAKGRVLADVLVRKQDPATYQEPLLKPSAYLPDILRELGAHYLSYFVDAERTYAVLVAKDGSLFAADIPLRREALRMCAAAIYPSTWLTSGSGFWEVRKEDISSYLSPLVAWLGPLVKGGLLCDDDHICYCPDEEMHLLPLHYILFQDKPLISSFSFSRIHSALALVSILKRRTVPLERSITFKVPTREDVDDSARLEDSTKLAELGRVVTFLAHSLPGEAFSGEEADIDRLAQFDFRGKVVHFSTHGTFPRSISASREQNPFYGSGLLLAKGGELPSLELNLTGNMDGSLLTPEKVLALDFSGSHVTLQACVSGLSKEGIGGDALGLEWAFLQAGAQSLLATHWDVAVAASADFCIRFYQKWLVQCKPRSQAWRDTARELMDKSYQDGKKRPQPYYWAGFSLSGDWR